MKAENTVLNKISPTRLYLRRDDKSWVENPGMSLTSAYTPQVLESLALPTFKPEKVSTLDVFNTQDKAVSEESSQW